MPTVVLNIYSIAYPSITNRIRASVFLQSDPQALISTIIDSTTGHPARTWSFPGLPRQNYGFSLDVIDSGDNVVSNLALFDVVPSELDGFLTRDDEQIQAGVTIGFDENTNTFTFDGTDGKPDYRGWNIVPSELTGRGILVVGLDYTWNPTSAQFTLIQAGDKFPYGQYYNIHFDPIDNPQGNSVPVSTDFKIKVVSTDYSISTDDFGNKLILEPPSSEGIKLTLPHIETVPVGRYLMIDATISNFDTSGQVVAQTGETINFLNGFIFILPNESLYIYRFLRSVGVSEWRICNCDGNFKTVGQCISYDQIQTGIINALWLNGASIDVNTYKRLYSQYVLRLPLDQVVNYDDWILGTSNQSKFSLANSANPANDGKFRIPNRIGLFEMGASQGNDTGAYTPWTIADHQHEGTTGTVSPTLFGRGLISRLLGKYGGGQTSVSDATGTIMQNGSGTVNIPSSRISNSVKPDSYSSNKYVLI